MIYINKYKIGITITRHYVSMKTRLKPMPSIQGFRKQKHSLTPRSFLRRHKEQESSSQGREVKSLSKQLRSTEDELAAVTRNRDSIIKENKRLQSDLTLMTDENQVTYQRMLPFQASKRVSKVKALLAE